ncbi:hypothetical protein GCM10007973_19210 [Polymorphobacter multimanifer]|nr:hypothetical protein GCM10007973_19210 [Polymorphobacter multimanifer]
MGKKPRPATPRPAARIPVAGNERVRVEVEFDKPQLLVPLFGQYDQNLIALEGQLEKTRARPMRRRGRVMCWRRSISGWCIAAASMPVTCWVLWRLPPIRRSTG